MPCRMTRRIGCTVMLAAAVSLGGCQNDGGSTDRDGGDSGNASDGTLSDGRTADDATSEGAAGDDDAATDSASGDEAGEDSGTNDAAKTADATTDAPATDADAGEAAETSAGDAGAPDAGAADARADGGLADGAVDCTAVPPKLSLSPTSLFLTSRCQGTVTSAPTVAISLTNSGSDPVTWTASAGPTVRLTHTGSTIPGNGQDAVVVDLVSLGAYPSLGETIADSIWITEVSPAGCTHVVSVTEGFEGYWYSPTDLEFGNVQVGHSASKHVTVTFVGSSYFTGSLFVSGNATGDFSSGGQVGGAGGPLEGFDVIFAPTATGSDQATFVWGGYNVSNCSPPVTANGTGTP